MLAIQYIKMYWMKENRTPKGSVMRKKYYTPEKIDSSVILEPRESDYFIQKRFYIQKDKVYVSTDYNKLLGNGYINSTGLTEAEQDNLGLFYSDVKDIDIPGIEILKEGDDYRIRWYSLENGYQPVRRGYNEEYYLKNMKCSGKQIKCETAFVLQKGESGKIEYNYRYTSYRGQHYEQYCIYLINTDQITHKSFMKAKYEKEYIELADLF